MTVLSPQIERTLTRPWSTATALAALFVALEAMMGAINLFVFYGSESGFGLGDRLETIGDEWLRYVVYLVIGLAAVYVLRLAAGSDVSHAWPALVLRAAILYVPVSIAATFVAAFTFALAHDGSFPFLGFEILG